MKLSDTSSGIVFMAGGIAIAVAALRFPDTPGQVYGAGFFPALLGLAMTIAGAALAFNAWRSKTSRPMMVVPDWAFERQDVVSFIAVLVTPVFYLLVADTLGFAATALIIIIVLALWFGASIKSVLLTSPVVVYAFELVFGRLLRVPLPKGALDLLL